MNTPSTAIEPVRELPSDVSQRLSFWRGLWQRSAQYHYFFGVVSVAASVISTSLEGPAAKGFSIVAAIATALIGFMHPERRYIKFVRAWRVLDVAAMRYRHGLIEKPELIDAVEKGETLIADFEERLDGSEAEVNQPLAVPPVTTAEAANAAAPASRSEAGDAGSAPRG